MKTLVIYHGHCDDGFAAAWAVRYHLGEENLEFFPGVYGKPPPDVTGRDVVMVDFSYKRPVIDLMIAQCRTLLILDHHKTAAQDLAGLPPAGVSFHEWAERLNAAPTRPHVGVGVLFDMHRSGAGIAWDFFSNRAHTSERRPEFIDYIEDRDLWKKSLPHGDQFTIALRAFPQEFQVWDSIVARGIGNLIQEGTTLWRYYRARIDEMAKTAYLAVMVPAAEGTAVLGVTCAIANAPYFAASELAHDLCVMEGAKFGACYFEVRPGEWQYSLRSVGDFDVSEIAKVYGGGGHKNAAGFTVKTPAHHALGS